jgi:hypothetical protein
VSLDAQRRRRLASALREAGGRINEYGWFGAFWREFRVRVLWGLLTRMLVRRYERGQKSLGSERASGRSQDEIELSGPVADLGRELASRLCHEYAGKYAHVPLRILIHTPVFGAGRVWMDDLASCMRHTGLPVCQVDAFAPDFAERFEAFQPNVLMSSDAPDVLRSLDLERIEQYKREHGLFRLFSIVNPVGWPRSAELSADDRWRIGVMRRGLSADGLFSLMADEYYLRFCEPWHDLHLDFLSLPMAANPLTQYPRTGPKDLDWALPTNNADAGERAVLTWRYMRDILRDSRGILAGANWGGGILPLAHDEVPALIARARICPNPRPDTAAQYPTDIGPKTFEVPAMGGFVLASRTAALPLFFAPDEIAAAYSPTEFNQMYWYFLARPEERYEYVRRGMLRVYEDHTYFNRVDKLVAFLLEETAAQG